MNAIPANRVPAESPLLRREPLARPDLVPEVVLDELEGTGPEVGDLDQVREDPVAVELQQRDQVQEDHDVVEERELVQQVCERTVGEERRSPGPPTPAMTSSVNGPADDWRIRCLRSSIRAVRRLDEERGRAEVDHEAGALHLPVVVRDHDRVPELVHERQEEREGEQDRRFGRRA